MSVHDHLAQLKTHDQERAWATLFATTPTQQQQCQLLLAMQQEWLAIPHKISDPMIGVMRLKWWQDALESVCNDQPHPPHPLVQAFVTLPRHPNQLTLLTDSLHGIETSLYEQPITTIQDLETYHQQVFSSLHLAILHLLVGNASPSLQKSVSHVGTAWAITTMLKNLPYDLARDHCLLPTSLLTEHQVTLDHFGSEQFKLACQHIVEALTNLAENHLHQANQALAEVPHSTRRAAAPVLLPAMCATRHIKQLRTVEHQLLTQTVRPLTGTTLLPMWWATRTGRYTN